MDGLVTNIENAVAQMSHGIIPISTLYIGLNALIALILAILVVRARMQTQTAIGDGGNAAMIQAIRAHANNVEYVPITLIVIAAVEIAMSPTWFVHTLGVALTAARLSHAVGLYQSTGTTIGRFLGTITTYMVLLAGSIACIYYGIKFLN